MVAKAYHSGDSEADNSQTPWWIIKQIQDIANVNIVFDVCATALSAKSDDWWEKEDDCIDPRSSPRKLLMKHRKA